MPACRKIWVGADGSIPQYVTIQVIAMNAADGTPNNTLDGVHVAMRKASSFFDIKIGGMTQANPIVVSTVNSLNQPLAHGYAAGDLVMHDGVVGMTQVNGKWYTVKNPTTFTYELWTLDVTPVTVDGTGFSAFSATGSPASHRESPASVNTLVHVSSKGVYELLLDATERNTLYYGNVEFYEAGIVAVHSDFQIVPDDPNAPAPSLVDVVNGVLDALASDHDIANTIGAKINAAGAAGDPLTNAVPGSYGVGSAGAVLGSLTNTNTEVVGIKSKTDNLPAAPADETLIINATNALATAIAALPNATAIANALLDDTDAIETGLTPRGALRIMIAALAGLAAGLDTGSITFQNPAGTKTRITATGDTNGNRSAITLDPS